jgi:hypothetical protein
VSDEKVFEAGNDPADFTNDQVVAFLKSDDVTGDEYDRVMQAERDGRGRVGILNLSGDDPAEVVAEPDSSGDDGEMVKPDGTPAAGPNEAATGQDSPADQAKTVDDPHASGDEGLTAERYPDDAPASLGPDMPQTDAEQEAHDATVAALSREARNALPADVREGATPVRSTPYTPAEALKAAADKASGWARRGNTISPSNDES